MTAMKKAREFAENSRFNTEYGDAGVRTGIIVSGVSRNYLADALATGGWGGRVRVLELGMTWPLPEKKLLTFLSSCDRVLVLEEGDPLLESGVRELAQRHHCAVRVEGKDDLLTVQKTMSTNLSLIEDYLKGKGFSAEEISEGRIETNDLMTNPYRDKNFAARFILNQTVTVRSNKVDLIEQALRSSGELVSKGVIFDSQSYGSPVSYIFTRLNEIKPQMLEEATRNAREAALEFAKSSGSEVGKIRRASQGVFSIQPLLAAPGEVESYQINKRVRVVSTIEFWLE